MKKLVLLVLSLILMTACSNDDDGNTNATPETFDYNENLMGDLSDAYNAPTTLSFVIGFNTITASQSSGDVDYFTFSVPVGSELYEIVMDDYQSSDDAGFIGIVQENTFPADAANITASNLLGGLVYGISNRGNDILMDMGMLTDAQGFAGALPAGDYSIWLNQTGASSETLLNIKIRSIN